MTDNFQSSLMTIAIHSFKMLRKTQKDPQTPILKVKNKVKFFKDFFLKRTPPPTKSRFLTRHNKKEEAANNKLSNANILKEENKDIPIGAKTRRTG